MSNWYSSFREYCDKKGQKGIFELWNTIKNILNNSIELGENIFPNRSVGIVVVTLNGRLMNMVDEKEEEKYFYGLHPNDLTALKGIVRLNTRYSKKNFETEGSKNTQASFDFALSFIKRIELGAYAKSIGLKIDSQKMKGYLSMLSIPVIQVNSNPTLCTLDLITGDYVLASEYPDKFVDCVSMIDVRSTTNLSEYTRIMVELNKVDSLSDSVEYFLQKSSRKQLRNMEFATFSTLNKGLTDIVPVAVKFPDEEIKTTESGITLVNTLDNKTFDILCEEKELIINSVNCEFTGEDTNYIDNVRYEFMEKLSKFRKSVRTKIFSAPGIGSSSDSTVKVACATKSDIYNLTNVVFNNYSFGIMNFILSCILRSEIGGILPYSYRRDVGTPFNRYLREQIKIRDRVSQDI